MKRILIIAVLALAGAMPAAAQTEKALPIDAFYGTWTGGGVAENDDSVYFRTTARDFDVVIGPAGSGFRIDWTTVIRKGGDPNRPDIHRNQTTRTMVPTGKPGVWRCSDSGDPLTDREVCWSRLHDRTLAVYIMTVDEDGIYTLQQYDRTLSGAGMKLRFRSLSDGERERVVTGQLVKSGK